MSDWRPYEKKEPPPKKRVARDREGRAVINYLARQKHEDRGHTKGVGVFVIVIGVLLTALFPPLGILLAVIGLAVLVFGFVR